MNPEGHVDPIGGGDCVVNGLGGGGDGDASCEGDGGGGPGDDATGGGGGEELGDRYAVTREVHELKIWPESRRVTAVLQVLKTKCMGGRGGFQN